MGKLDGLLGEHYGVSAKNIISPTPFEVSLLAVLKEIVNELKNIKQELVYLR